MVLLVKFTWVVDIMGRSVLYGIIVKVMVEPDHLGGAVAVYIYILLGLNLL